MRNVPTVFLVLVDLDRAGKNMVDSMERNIRSLVEMLARQLQRPMPDLTFVHIGLTLEQANSFDEVDAAPVQDERVAELGQPHPVVRRGGLLLVGAHRARSSEGIKAQLDMDIRRETQRGKRPTRRGSARTDNALTCADDRLPACR